MMEDAGEDVLRQKPSMVVTFFKRIGQVRLKVVLIFHVTLICRHIN